MDKLLTRGDISAIFKCSTRTVFRLPLPTPIRVGHLVRWREEDINAWLEAGGTASAPSAPAGRPRGSRKSVGVEGGK